MKERIKYSVTFLVILCLFSIPLIVDFVSAAPSGGYKLVNFRTKSSSGINTSYTEAVTGEQGYTNGYYGADAVYLGTENGKVKFMQSGVIGYVNSWEVELLPMETQADYDKYYMSFYEVIDGAIVHKFATAVHGVSYGKATLGKNSIGLEVGKDYLSYDGHYFYPASLEGYKQMTDDYLSGNYSHAVNAGRPFYSYYQYLSHRSRTNYTQADIANYITNVLGYTSKVKDRYNLKNYESLLYGEQNTFINAQNAYGANALLMFGVAANESGYGRGTIALRTNNLFSHGAYDSAPGANADGYDTPADSINAHAKHFVSIDYMDPKDYMARYHGGHLGSKASGFNVKYASDPYWGEKAASQYYAFDKAYGFQDYGYYTLGIKTSTNNYNIYRSPDTSSNVLYNTTTITDYPVVILWEVTGTSINGNNKWYKIQTDPVLNSDRTAFVQDVGEYNYSNNYAYIHSSAIDVIVSQGVARINTTYNITFDANGGKFSDQTSSKTVNVQSGVTPTIENPTREGYDFVGWNETIVPATGNKTYKAQWKVKEYNITFDANGGEFKDGNKKRIVKTAYNQLPVVDEPIRDGYVFKGWEPEVVAVTKETTYKATWESAIFYDVTFNADGGTFSNGKEELVVKTAEGTIPTVETPFKDGYIFIGWTPELTETTGPTSYEAIWKKGTVEDYLTEKDGNFYLEYLKKENGKLQIKGYQTINSIDNNLEQDIHYELVFESKNEQKSVRQLLSRITDENELGRPATGSDHKDYTYSWFKGDIDIDSIENGDYKIYVVAYTDKVYSKNIVNNLLYKTQITNYHDEQKYALIRTDVSDDQLGIELMIRSEQLGLKQTSYMYSQYDQFREISFNGRNLNILGYSYSYGTDYSRLANVERTMIFENVETYQKYTYDIGSITNGLFTVTLPSSDGYDKTRAWYQASIDLSDIDLGTYAIYISNKTNVSDFGELKDLLYKDLDTVNTTIDGKKYQIYRDDDHKHRIMLRVEKEG